MGDAHWQGMMRALARLGWRPSDDGTALLGPNGGAISSELLTDAQTRGHAQWVALRKIENAFELADAGHADELTVASVIDSRIEIAYLDEVPGGVAHDDWKTHRLRHPIVIGVCSDASTEISGTSVIERVFRALRSEGFALPTREPDNKGAVAEGQVDSRVFASARPPRFRGAVAGPGAHGRALLRFVVDEFDGVRQRRLITMAREAGSSPEVAFAFVHIRTLHDLLHANLALMSDGKLALDQAFVRCTAALPWGFALGPRLVAMIGAARLSTVPALVENLGSGSFWIQLTESISDCIDAPQRVEAARRAVSHSLGIDGWYPPAPSESALAELGRSGGWVPRWLVERAARPPSSPPEGMPLQRVQALADAGMAVRDVVAAAHSTRSARSMLDVVAGLALGREIGWAAVIDLESCDVGVLREIGRVITSEWSEGPRAAALEVRSGLNSLSAVLDSGPGVPATRKEIARTPGAAKALLRWLTREADERGRAHPRLCALGGRYALLVVLAPPMVTKLEGLMGRRLELP